MADESSYRIECGNCGAHLGENREDSSGGPKPCPECGSTQRKHIVELASTITAVSTVKAQLSTIGTAVEHDTAMPVTAVGGKQPTVDDKELPTEVIAETVECHIRILKGENDKYPVEIRIPNQFGISGDYTIVVGEIDDIMIDLGIGIKDLAEERWKTNGP